MIMLSHMIFYLTTILILINKLNSKLMESYLVFFISLSPGEEIDVIPVAEHCDDATLADECEVGWIIRGKFIGGDNQPTFVFKGGSFNLACKKS